ncbi:enoyl-ACP reductase FabV [Aerococcus sp. 1KP-2016]|uniref:enoyl-ACP reductase FabV n=1 Tax=Aerococcus sp. 1KP-2016 TaxID=1981982 RepID=UPI000B992F3D|nr:enoyl-ACP reductase FabV [Aerococcus sp. 1KP-2016]OYQ65099.1 trans-2-enoyl-CoA reductase [Aerococcus sp. 1KP-2016]
MTVKIEAKMRGNVLVGVNPMGLKQEVANQIQYVKAQGTYAGPKKVLVIGGSSSYGLASRINLAFGAGADTISVSHGGGPRTPKNLGKPGWYNNIFFREAAEAEGLIAKNVMADAFSNEAKAQVIDFIKNEFGGKVDFVVYSLASGIRTDPATGETYHSAIKAIGEPVVGPNVNLQKETFFEQVLEPATDEEIANTVKVMGGEDWRLWMTALREADVLSEGVQTVVYSYLGAELNESYYNKGTLGRAKADCDRFAALINEDLAPLKGQATVVVATAVTTKASSVIPFFPVYCLGLYKVMSDAGLHETPIMHIDRIFRDMICGDNAVYDEAGRMRPDAWELDPDIQAKTKALIEQINQDNFNTDFTAWNIFMHEFLNLNGFDVDGYVEIPVTFEELASLEA